MTNDAAKAYRSLAPSVLGYLRAERAADPEDLLGEVFLQVARDIRKFRGDEQRLRSWVFSIAHNRLIDAHRQRARRPAVEPLGSSTPAHTQASAFGSIAEPFDPGLMSALETLTAEQRETLVLRFIADLPLEAVASITKRPVSAVKSLQHRGLEQLRKNLSGPVSPEMPAPLTKA